MVKDLLARWQKAGLSAALILFLLTLAGLPFVLHRTLNAHARGEALREARAFSSVISIVRSYYANNVSARILQSDGKVTLTERYHNIPGGVPIPATLSIELGEAIRSRLPDAAVLFSFVSDAPFRNRDRPRLDTFQADALRAFRRGDSPEFWRIEKDATGPDRLRLAIPVVMEAPCVVCHNSHPDSPRRNWKVGDVRGIQDVSVDLSLSGQAEDSLGLAAYLMFLAGTGLATFHRYRRDRSALQRINTDLEASRTGLQTNELTLRQTIEDLRTKSTVLDKAPFGIAISDPLGPDMPLVYVNEAFCQMTGYKAEEVLLRNCRFLQGKDTSSESIDAIREAIASRSTREVEILNYRRNGEPFWNRFLIFPSFDDQGELLHFVGCQTDITLLKQADEMRRQLSGEQHLTRQIAALRQSVARTAHEMAEPLGTAIAASHDAQAMTEPGTPADGKPAGLATGLHESVGRIHSSLVQVSRLINRLQQLSGSPLKRKGQAFDLRPLLESVLAKSRTHAGAVACTLSLDCAEDWHLYTDRISLHRVLLHLVCNALEHAFDGRENRQVRICVLRQEQGLELCVVDNGNGLDDPVILRTLSASGGMRRLSGLPDLGLFDDRRTVEEVLEGSLELLSIPGGGTTCRIMLPEHAIDRSFAPST